jgi:hypothetical protein
MNMRMLRHYLPHIICPHKFLYFDEVTNSGMTCKRVAHLLAHNY